mgnify:CR=1 FL=1
MKCPMSFNMERTNPMTCTEECAWYDGEESKCAVPLIASCLNKLVVSLNNIAPILKQVSKY